MSKFEQVKTGERIMPCAPIPNGVLCLGGSVYDVGGFFFEIHHYCGPTPLRRNDHAVRKNIPSGFWPMWERFTKLSVAERQRYRAEFESKKAGSDQ